VNFEFHQGTAWNRCLEVDEANAAFGSMTDTEFVFVGRKRGPRT